MKSLTEKEVNKLPIGTVLYYEEWSPALEKWTWRDIVKVIGHTEYSGPTFKVILGILNRTGVKYTAATYEISNGRAKAIDDKKYVIKMIWELNVLYK